MTSRWRADSPRLLHTPDEAAELLRCKASWLKEKARRREIPFTFIGGAYRFSDAHLEQIIRQFEHAPERAHVPAPRRRGAAGTATDAPITLRSRPPRSPRPDAR